MKISAVTFKGCAAPFADKNGNIITPIAQKPDQRTVNAAIDAAEQGCPFAQGANGLVFEFGRDLVIKKHKGIYAYNQDTERETAVLNKMYDAGVFLPGSQMGMYAVKTPKTVLLVSSKVKGKGINPVSNPFNKKKFESLLDIIFEIDKGYILKNSSETGGSDRCRLMHYDFNAGNIRFHKNKAGLLDFENSKFENLDDLIEDTVINKNHGINPHRSDTSELPSSLRSFEFSALNDYLKSSPDAYDILNTYLIEKGKYHEKMSGFYNEFASESSSKYIVKDTAEREKAHSELLKPDNNGKIPSDIMQAEIMKIQSADFLYNKSRNTNRGVINQQELKNYTNNSLKYFKDRLKTAENSGDKNRIIYYADAVSLMEDWCRVNDDIQNLIDKRDKKMLQKLTVEHIYTLDDAVTDSFILNGLQS